MGAPLARVCDWVRRDCLVVQPWVRHWPGSANGLRGCRLPCGQPAQGFSNAYVRSMTGFRVDAEEVARLGTALSVLADDLSCAGEGSVDRWALGPGRSGAAFEELVSHWRLQRLRLAQALEALSQSAAAAGGLYADTEAVIGGRLMIGGDR